MTDDVTSADVDDGQTHEPPTVLVPLAVLEGETIPETVATFLDPVSVVVLGYHVLPEQTPTEQASMQFEDRAQETIADVAAVFDGDVETRIAFTHDRDQTVERVAAEIDATAILHSNPGGPVEDVLVPLRGAIDADRLADLVALLVAEHRVTLWGLQQDGFDADAAVADASERLRSRGLPAERITTETTLVDGDPIRAIVARSVEFDAIVMGEGKGSLRSALFGEDEDRVAEATVAPVLVVRSGDKNDES
jgi:nucleotide-binding universal stress UspA family protein